MEENAQSAFVEGEIVGIRFGLATPKEITTASVSECPINHASQLTNSFLGLPIEFGKCDSCGTAEAGKCEGHFGYIELPIPIYHPSHISELKRLLSLLCLKCLKLKPIKVQAKSNGVAERLISCCEEASQVSIKDIITTTDGPVFLQLKLPRKRHRDDLWSFLDRYGFHYGNDIIRTLLPCEVMEILKRIPQDTKKKLARKGYFPQEGYIMQFLPVPPNCLSVPEVSDGVSVMSSDLSISMLKKVLKQVEIIKSSRSGPPNFEAHEVEATELQKAVDQYLQVRGTARASRDVESRLGIHKELNDSSTKAWLEKMRTLFIRKGSGFSSRSVITGDAYKRANEVGIPFEIAQRITFEERVSVHNVKYLQELVDNKLCMTYRDGSSTYSLRDGSKGHTFLRPGQVVHRRIMDGDTVFINRPPTTHKHSLQALSVYVHDDHTVKINPLICGPLSADFDGDCVHLFYPQSLAAKAEVLELFSVEKQLLSSHSGNLNLQLTTDSLLSLKNMFKLYFLDRAAAQQLAMFVSFSLPQPSLWKVPCNPIWTVLQILQTALPSQFDCVGERYLINNGDIVNVDFSRDVVQAIVNEIVISIFFEKGPDAVFKFFNSLQPLLMENIFSEGFSVSLKDFYISRTVREIIHKDFKSISDLLVQLRSNYNELVEQQLESHIRSEKLPIAEFVMRSSSLGDLIDSRSDSAMTKVIQQIGFLGLQISDRGKFYSKTLVEDMASHFERKYPSDVVEYPSAKYGLIQNCFFHGLDPYEEMVHSISTREVIVRSSRGLAEPGTLFKNLMAILRDVVICYDGTVRNVCSNSIIQFEYGVKAGIKAQSLFPAGEPVGVLAATAMSNPAYKAVLDSTPSSNSSWELMKEILLCRVNFKNDTNDRRIILYFNDCDCAGNYCQEKAAYLVKNHLEKVILKDIANCFMIEYKRPETIADGGLVGHFHLKQDKLEELKVSMEVIHQKCIETVNKFRKKKKLAVFFKRIEVYVSQCCSFQSGSSCLSFFWKDADIHVEQVTNVFADVIYPVLLDTVIRGDSRVSSANIIWVSPNTTTWIRSPSKNLKGELALDIVLEKSAVKQSGDAWRIVLDSCLPVLHLIDSTRSTPYAIKQIQEMLGVSCAFDQAVQRLSASVTMVAKGVLKEHLILLANSMTCAGNLVGFNSGGYKSLSHALDVQVPFTDATLFTPRKCFERAAEKCHVDTLSGIVASCSWGKNVAVGTGSRFDVLWDKKEAGLNQEGSIEVYEFLNMVRSSTNGEESTACLGADVDDLDYGMADWNLSPERDIGSDKPIFEDSVEFQEFDKSGGGWDTGGGWQTHANGKAEDAPQTDSWSGWGKTEASDASARKEDTGTSGDWDADAGWGKKAKVDDAGWSKAENTAEANSRSAWGRIEVSNAPATKDLEESGRASDWNANAWGKTSQVDDGGGNNASERQQQWGKSKSPEGPSDWGSSKEPFEAAGWSQASAGGNDKSERQQQWGTPKLPETSHSWGSPKASKAASSKAWGEPNAKDNEEGERQEGWAKPKSAEISQGWGSAKGIKAASSQGWEMANTKDSRVETQPGWGKPKSPENSKGWGSLKTANAASSEGWGVPNAEDSGGETRGVWGKPKHPENSQVWVSPKPDNGASSQGWGMTNSEESGGRGRQGWENPKSPEISQGWGSPKAGKSAGSQGWGVPNSEDSGVERQQGWGKPKSPEVSQAWGSPKASKSANSGGWGMSNAEGSEKKPWGQQAGDFRKNRAEGSKGWGSNPDWKNKNRPARSPRIPNDGSSVGPMYTATRQRLDMFNSEEQDILSEVDPLMYSIRRVMHQSGYNDGDQLSDADQSLVLDKVFNYHPDKAGKVGAGVDRVIIDKSSFQDSKCFYVVSTDGSRQDFSYRKCLENFVKVKYPDLAEEFNNKYFTKPRSRVNLQQTPATPGNGDYTQMQTPASEGTGDASQQQDPVSKFPEVTGDASQQQNPVHGVPQGGDKNQPENPVTEKIADDNAWS